VGIGIVISANFALSICDANYACSLSLMDLQTKLSD